ncbi:unnamed protein product, partial [Rotaria socialis]
FPPLPSDIDLPSYANTPDPYDNRHNALELFYCVSPPLPSPPSLQPSPLMTPLSAETMTRIYTNCHTVSSIRSHDNMKQQTISFATQFKKKARAPVVGLLQGVYINMPVSNSLPSPLQPPPPLRPSEPLTLSNEVTYATLMNTTSAGPSTCSDQVTNHVHYQEIHIENKSAKTNSSRIYENIKTRRPPPPPCYSQTKFLKRTSSSSAITIEAERSPSYFNILDDNII